MKYGLCLLGIFIIALHCTSVHGQNVKSQLEKKYNSVIEEIDYSDGQNIVIGYKVKNGNYSGYCDINGKETISPQKYSDVSFSKKNNQYRVSLGDFQGILDSLGHTIIPPDKYNIVYHRFIDRYKVKIGDKMGVLNSRGNEIITPERYTDISYDKWDNFYKVKSGEKIGLVDSSGNEIIEPLDGYYSMTYRSQGPCIIALVEKDKKTDSFYRILDSQGKEVLACGSFLVSEGVLFYKKNNLWGLAKATDGTILEAPRFTGVERFENGIARVIVGDTSFLITNPLKDGGKTISSLMAGHRSQSDIDRNVPQTDRVAENTFAVIIANESYSDFSVPFAINDGRAVKDYCNKTLGIPATNIIHLENATLNNMLGTLNRIAEIAEVFDGEAQLLIYYSGIGLSDNAGNPYLMPVDATPSMLSSTAMSLSSLYEKMGSLNTDWTLMLIDAGFTGENRDGKVPTCIAAKAQKNKSVAPLGNMVVISAASLGETALQYDEMQHGTFTYFLCKKLQQSKGNVSFAELAEYIISNTKTIKQSRNDTLNNQHPEIISVDEKLKKQRL